MRVSLLLACCPSVVGHRNWETEALARVSTGGGRG